MELTKNRPLLASLILSVSSAFLLSGYEIIRSSTNSLFKAAYGVDQLPLVIAITPIGIFGMLWIYGKLLSSLGPRRTLSTTTLGSGFLIAVCYSLIALKMKWATILLFVVREAYAVLLIEQFWSFINSILDEVTAKKYNGLILGLSTLGSISGGVLLNRLVGTYGTESMVLLGAFLCLPCWVFGQIAYGIGGDSERLEHKKHKKKSEDVLGLGLFSNNPVLVIVFAMILFSQFYAFFMSMNFQEILQVEFPDMDAQTAFSGMFFAVLNSCSLFMQLIMAPLLLSLLPVHVIHIAIPVLNLALVTVAFLQPGLYTCGAAYMLFKAMDYSVFRAAKEILYIPLSFDVRFRAKEIIDVLGYRLGKGAASWGTSVLEKLVLMPHFNFLFLGMLVAGGWLLIVLPLQWTRSREHVPLTE
ncbi:MAG: hypothetical protein HYW48_08390 [Deltaproteobacteria bacterium]|nr:hypothetical protein [Deltaproteobacteria bacterium]